MAKGELFSVGCDVLLGYKFVLVLCARQVEDGVDNACNKIYSRFGSQE